MASSAFLLAIGALVACKVAALISVDSKGHFENLPRPTQID